MIDEAEFELHRRVARELEVGVHDRDWWVWIELLPEDHWAADTSLDGLADHAAAWLSSLDVDAEQGETVWSVAGLDVRLRARRRPEKSRGKQPLVGNPLPAFAYFMGA